MVFEVLDIDTGLPNALTLEELVASVEEASKGHPASSPAARFEVGVSHDEAGFTTGSLFTLELACEYRFKSGNMGVEDAKELITAHNHVTRALKCHEEARDALHGLTRTSANFARLVVLD